MKTSEMDNLGVLTVPMFWICIIELSTMWTIVEIIGRVLEEKTKESEDIWLQQTKSKYHNREEPEVTDITCEVDLPESG